ncbi:MAG: alpha/beta hydrolase [Knoellia sp.]
MALTWGNIKQWSPATLDTAETDLRKARRSMLDLADELETMGLPKQWHGDASQASRTRLTNVTQDLKDVVAEVSAAYTAVCDAADGVRGVELAVDAAQEFATLHRLSISADGTVTDTGPAIDTGNEQDNQVALDEREGWVTECVDRIEQALRKANDVDTDLGDVLEKIELNRIHVGAGGLATASKVGEVEGDLSLLKPPEGATPSDSAAWWATLSPDERKQIIAKHPGWIGNRDGVDATSRDLANRNLLDDRRTHVNSRIADIEATWYYEDGSFNWVAHNLTIAEYNDLTEERGAIRTLDDILDNPGEHQLVGLDFTTARTQAIVANGNIDTADHVAVFTPGLTSTVEGIDGYNSNMAELRTRTEDELFRNGDGGTVATVTWLDYQAPQWGTTFAGDSVALSGSAEDGGGDLADYFRGINASRLTDPDLTSLAHSYGSTTAGYGLQHEGTGVDRAVFFGSPGLGTSDLDVLQIPDGSAYYAEAKWDGVGDLARFGSDPTGLDGMQHLQTGEATSADGRSWEGVSGHSSYLQDGSTSQYSMAQLVGGNPQGAIEGQNVGWFTDPIKSQSWIPDWLK